MKRLISRHKTTIVAVIALIFIIPGIVRWTLGQIDELALGAYAGVVGSIATVLIGLLSKDGDIKKQE